MVHCIEPGVMVVELRRIENGGNKYARNLSRTDNESS